MPDHPDLATRDRNSGCTGGFGCWSEIGDGGLTKIDQSDTCNDWLADWYARNGDQSFGWHKDYFLNRMTASHTHGFGDTWYVGRSSSVIVGVSTMRPISCMDRNLRPGRVGPCCPGASTVSSLAIRASRPEEIAGLDWRSFDIGAPRTPA